VSECRQCKKEYQWANGLNSTFCSESCARIRLMIERNEALMEVEELKGKLETEEKAHYYKDQAYKIVKADNEELKSSKNYLTRLVKKLEKEVKS